jgi:hypothetical protein
MSVECPSTPDPRPFQIFYSSKRRELRRVFKSLLPPVKKSAPQADFSDIAVIPSFHTASVGLRLLAEGR